MRLVSRLFLSFLLVVLLLGGISVVAGYGLITQAILDEAQFRTKLNLRSAEAQLRDRLGQVRIKVESVARANSFAEAAGGQASQDDRRRLERQRVYYGLDVLSVTDATGRVTLRGQAPYSGGGDREHDPVVSEALGGRPGQGYVVLEAEQLRLESSELAGVNRSYVPLVDTPHAKPRPDEAIADGMMLWAAAPLVDGEGKVIGAVYGGVLLNRNEELVDSIRDVLFTTREYESKPLGTVTIFLQDVRVATNVLDAHGSRAIGTRVSGVVYDRVLESGKAWEDRAFVVDEWYISAYEPIRNPDGRVIGILYTGVLEQKYLDQRNRILWSYGIPLAAGIALAVVLSLVLARTIAKPVNELEVASERLAEGDLDYRPKHYRSVWELEGLSESFRKMADRLSDRDMKLREQNVELEEANVRLTQLNEQYMDMLGFVSHELKSPLNSMIFGATSVRDELVGPLNAEQKKIMATVLRNADYLEEMIANYLDLSRIEQGQMEVHKRPARLAADVVGPILEQMQKQVEAARMAVRLDIAADLEVEVDRGMMRIVVDNLVSNAVKYGREGGQIEVKATQTGAETRLIVQNEGEGITPEGMSRLFGKFVRLDRPSSSRHRKGTGLGLFVSRDIVQRHGGRIWAESEPGEWVRFIVALPGSDGRKSCEQKA